jgi:type VI secretion system protein ImpM
MDQDCAPGFYGKIVSHGDFVSRRLPPAFVAVWDGWLQAVIRGSREQLGAGWLDAYLASPLWRFALAPGVCDGQAWGGVLMPSVDRVGRHFPLVLAAGVPGDLALGAWMGEGTPWFDQLEELALSTLDAGFAFERFDGALQSLESLPPAPAQGTLDKLGWHAGIAGAADAASVAQALACAALHGQSVWSTDGSDRVEPCVRLCRGLPAAPVFSAMLGG